MKLLFILFTLIISFNLNAQNPYYDALILKEFSTIDRDPDSELITIKLDSNNIQKVAEVFKSYGLAGDDLAGIDYSGKIDSILKVNPFLDVASTVQSFAFGGGSLRTGPKSMISGIGGLDVTTFADGLTLFLIDRAKQELNIAFFERFRKFLEKNPEASTLFPSTTEFIGNILAHEYTTFIQSLREAFYDDLHNLIYNIDDVFYLPRFNNLINKYPEIVVSINLIQTIVNLEKGAHASDIIKELRDLPIWTKKNKKGELIVSDDKYALKNLYNSLKLSYILTNSVRYHVDETLKLIKVDSTQSTTTISPSYCYTNPLRDSTIVYTSRISSLLKNDTILMQITEEYIPVVKCEANSMLTMYPILINKDTTILENYSLNSWVSKKDFMAKVIRDEITFRIFLGLIYQLTKSNEVLFVKNNTEEDQVYFHDYMEANIDRLISFQSLFVELIDKGSEVQNAFDEINQKRNDGEKLTKEDFYKYINSSINIVEFGFKMAKKVNPKIEADEFFKIAKSSNNLYKNTYEKQYSAVVLNASSILTNTLSLIHKEQKSNSDPLAKETRKGLKAINSALYYGTFMANVVDANDASEVKSAIETAALPVGSSSVKKLYRNNVAINAYLGAYMRTEKDFDVTRSWDQRFGFIAPIGISYTPFSLNKGGSVSVFASILDVGALAQFRLSNDSTEIKEEISLSNIFSPGGYLVYGFGGNLPLSFGFGGQYGPGLYKIDIDEETEVGIPGITNPGWRWNVFLAVDLPIINIYRGKRRKVKL